MTLYEELGLPPIINASATLTKLGGSKMPAEVVKAMNDAAASFIALEDLQVRVGEQIAALTNNEACYVSCGAAAGIVAAVSAVIAGTDPCADRQFPLPRSRSEIGSDCRAHPAQRL